MQVQGNHQELNQTLTTKSPVHCDGSMSTMEGSSIAANILQVVNTAAQLLSTGHQIYQAGVTLQISDLEHVTSDFQALLGKLEPYDGLDSQGWDKTDLGPLNTKHDKEVCFTYQAEGLVLT
jgi:hypothetical protein